MSMKTKKKKSINIYWIAFVILLVFLIAFLIISNYQIEKNKFSEIKYLKNIISTEAKIYSIQIELGDKANEYYNLASEEYIKENYKGVVFNCEKARAYYSKEGQEYRVLKQKLGEEKIMLLYKDLLLEKIKLTNNLYEACEYFESASKYYDIYFNTNVLYDDPSYEMGGISISSMSEKIAKHDEVVEVHNNILAEITVRLEEINKNEM